MNKALARQAVVHQQPQRQSKTQCATLDWKACRSPGTRGLGQEPATHEEPHQCLAQTAKQYRQKNLPITSALLRRINPASMKQPPSHRSARLHECKHGTISQEGSNEAKASPALRYSRPSNSRLPKTRLNVSANASSGQARNDSACMANYQETTQLYWSLWPPRDPHSPNMVGVLRPTQSDVQRSSSTYSSINASDKVQHKMPAQPAEPPH